MTVKVTKLTTAHERLLEDQERTNSFYAKNFDDLKKFRVTSLQSAEECPKRWFADTIGENVQSTQNIHTKIGTLIHLLCENKLRIEFWKQELLEPKAVASTIKELYTLAPIKELVNFTNYCTRLESLTREWELMEIESEYKMPIPTVPLPIFGQIDAVFRHKTTGQFRVLDHKTNRRPETFEIWQKKLQPQLYSSAIMVQYEVNEIEFAIGQVNQKEDIYFPYYASDVEKVQDRCRKIWETILRTKEKQGEGKINKYCAFCGHKEGCKTYDSHLTILTMLGTKQ